MLCVDFTWIHLTTPVFLLPSRVSPFHHFLFSFFLLYFFLLFSQLPPFSISPFGEKEGKMNWQKNFTKKEKKLKKINLKPNKRKSRGKNTSKFFRKIKWILWRFLFFSISPFKVKGRGLESLIIIWKIGSTLLFFLSLHQLVIIRWRCRRNWKSFAIERLYHGCKSDIDTRGNN